MAKTDKTIQLERDIYKETIKHGVFGCFEVTIGWYGNERVDYMTYDTKNVWRCYEIKVSKSDFHSKAHNTFIGNFNYYVLTSELYEQIKDEIPAHIGVYCGSRLVKRPKKQTLKVDEQVLKNSMIRSLSREFSKYSNTCDVDYLSKLKSTISRLEKQNREEHDKSIRNSNAIYEICEVYGLEYAEVRKLVKSL